MHKNYHHPFGMGMSGRKFSSGSYRYGFNGKEKDNDVSGDGNQYDYGFRIYNPRIGRFLSVDPLSAKYPWYTPYQFAGNKPVQCIDLDGTEEKLPYLQSNAFDCIEGTSPTSYFTRGQKGDKLGTTLPDKRGDFERFIESVIPMQLEPIQPAPHIAQAINFGNSVGSVVYDYDEKQKGNVKWMTDANEAFMSRSNTVYLNISGYSEMGTKIIENLRATHGLKELSDVEIADYISGIDFVFEPGKDYSNLFWKQVKLEPTTLLAGGPITLPLPLSPSVPIILPPLNGTNSVNGENGSITVSTISLSQEIAATLAPNILQMAEHKTNQRPSNLPKHQKGQARGKQDREGSKGMKDPPRKRPPGHKGPWPPKKK